MTDASDAVWNRAAMEAGGPDARAGDQAVAGVLRFHSRAMSSGVVDSLTELDPVEVDEAIDGLCYLGLDDAAAVVTALRQDFEGRSADEYEAEADARYAAVVPDDDVLLDAFQRLFGARPSDFAPPG
jgi:hypothetical protein